MIRCYVTNTFLKSVSAFANYGSGEFVFGISDDGKIVGLENSDMDCIGIENKINDTISPTPDYRLDINDKDKTISLKVFEGIHKPYYYRNKAYMRADTSTVEVDRIELNRLILEGSNRYFEEMPAYNNELSFSYLENKLIDKLQIHELSEDILRTLDLYYNPKKMNRVAEILSDNNSYSGIDMVRFGESIDKILDRETYDNMSVLQQFDKALLLFKRYYSYEEIIGSERLTRENIPEKASEKHLLMQLSAGNGILMLL